MVQIVSAKANTFFGSIAVATVLLMAPTYVTAQTGVAQEARSAVENAREAMQKKQWKQLDNYIQTAKSDPLLGAYPAYWQLYQKLQSGGPVPYTEVQNFIKTSNNNHLSDRIQAELIVATARSGDYAKALQLGTVQTTNASVECSLILSRFMTGETVSAQQAMGTFAPVTACWTMLDELASSKAVGWHELSFELRSILETNKTGTAQRMAAIMFDGAQMVHYAALIKNPKQWLAKQPAPTTQAQIELVTLALSRLARSDDRAAEVAYINKNWAGKLPAENLEWVFSQFGLIAALNVDTEALKWYRLSGSQRLTDYNHAWEVRAELRGHPIDWGRIQASIDRMTPRQASEPVWVYWKARALEAQGRKADSMALYASIANELSFYGQLSNEALGHTPFIPEIPATVTTAELQEARSNLGLQRAVALFDLDWRPEAVQQWVFALRGMSDRQLLAAAEYARQEQIYDRVVNTSLLTRNEIDFRQRFIAPFEGRVTAKAHEIGIDPAWVYGLIRQESRFIMNARSRVGASGLMQLMPDTARWVAKKIGMTNFDLKTVNEFDTNTVLGTNYLRIVLSQLDGSEMLASAGYNAGPGRPKQWRSKLLAPVEGAVFAETIPFTETRLYVKNVMSNAVYYAMMFTGKPHYLTERLGMVGPSGTVQVARP